jgi:alpha-ketoglutarate-dependent taurine dioxygenase
VAHAVAPAPSFGDVVVWDNTGMLHRALPYDPSSERSMQRTTMAGAEASA